MKLFVGRTIGRHVELMHDESMMDLAVLLADRDSTPQFESIERGYVKGDALVSRSRSMLASHFLRTGADVFLSIDGDIQFRPEDAISLAMKCADGHDLIGALYMTRAVSTQPALMLPAERVNLWPGTDPVETKFISTGFMACHRRVFERLAQDLPLCHQSWSDRGIVAAFWPFYMPFCIPWGEGDEFMYLSEDWALCQRARDAGFKIWLDPSIRLGHIGEYTYRLEDLIRPEIPSQPMGLERATDGNLSIYTSEPPPPNAKLTTEPPTNGHVNRAERRRLAHAGR